MTAAEKTAFYYLMLNPPFWMIQLWAIAALFMACTLLLSSGHIREHVDAASRQGFGGNPFVGYSCGPRADRIMHLLLMPPVFSVSALAQMFVPRIEPLCSLLRTVQVAFALVRLAELIYLVAGGWLRVERRLPKEPFPVFGQPPLCLCFGWPCCAREITETDIYLMALGMRQFSFVAPILGTIDTCCNLVRSLRSPRFNSESSFSSVILTVLTLAYSLTTLIGMWSFNNLYHVLSGAVPQSGRRLKERQMFVVMQMVSSKLVDMLLTVLLVSEIEFGLQTEQFMNMDKEHAAAVLSGFYLCVVELLLAMLGRRAFNVDTAVYPEPELAADYPLDMLPQLQLCGVRQGAYSLLQQLEEEADTRRARDCSSSEDGEDSAEDAEGRQRLIPAHRADAAGGFQEPRIARN